MKYYFISAWYQDHIEGEWRPMRTVTNEHPLKWEYDMKDYCYDCCLSYWQEVTEADYILYEKIRLK